MLHQGDGIKPEKLNFPEPRNHGGYWRGLFGIPAAWRKHQTIRGVFMLWFSMRALRASCRVEGFCGHGVWGLLIVH